MHGRYRLLMETVDAGFPLGSSEENQPMISQHMSVGTSWQRYWKAPGLESFIVFTGYSGKEGVIFENQVLVVHPSEWKWWSVCGPESKN